MDWESCGARLFGGFGAFEGLRSGATAIGDAVVIILLASTLFAWRRSVRNLRSVEKEKLALQVDLALLSVSLESGLHRRRAEDAQQEQLLKAQNAAPQNHPRELLEILAKETFGSSRQPLKQTDDFSHSAETAFSQIPIAAVGVASKINNDPDRIEIDERRHEASSLER